MAARIDNPNRVGSGFINLGPMQRQPQAASANWQTGSLLAGGSGRVGAPTPLGVSDIWNNTPQPPPLPPQQPAPPMGAPPGIAGRYGASDQTSMNMDFQQLHIGSAAPSTAMPGQSFPGGLGAGPYGMGLGDVHGSMVPQPPPAAQAPSLMNLLHTSAPTPASAGINSAFALGNGSQPTCGQVFGGSQMTQPPVSIQGNGIRPTPFQQGAFVPPVVQPPPRPPTGPPRVLSTPADYAAAAQTYKPPVPARNSTVAAVSVSRQPEASKSQPSQPVKEEWECPRCTFLNNIALRECEMCAFERVGKEESAPRSEDDGWHTASSTVRRSAPIPYSNTMAGKSKAQSKNEKRRAKKRGEH